MGESTFDERPHREDMHRIHHFRIADFHTEIIFQGTSSNGMYLLPSFYPFEDNTCEKEATFFRLTVDDSIRPFPKERRERIGDFDTGNGHTIVDVLDNGGYQYIIKDILGRNCCLLLTNKSFSDCRCALNGNASMRNFGLNSALMMIFAFKGSFEDTVLIHASLVRHDEKGYAFIAKSGTGKSTHVNLWLSHIPGCDLMNDDNPIVRIIDGKAYIYGSPWSGKTPCYRNVKAALGAITRIDRATSNSVDQLSVVEAFASLLPACSTMKWDKDIFDNICNIISKIIKTTPIYTLHCLPDKDAALLCHKTISR